MDPSRPEIPKDPDKEPGQTTAWETSQSFCSDKEQRRFAVTQDARTNGMMFKSTNSVSFEWDVTHGPELVCPWKQCCHSISWSQRLLRAESLLRSTFNPSLKWLFHGYSRDDEEGNLVVAHNLVSRSSTHLLRLQQALLSVALCRSQTGSAHVCMKALPDEGSVSGHYGTLRKLLERRALLLFLHESTSRTRLAAAYVSSVQHLLEEQLMRTHLTQVLHIWSSLRVDLGLISQELRVHLNHWPCLLSRIQSDPYLRRSVVQHTSMLLGIKQTLDSLGLQSLFLVEQVGYILLCAVAQSELDTVPREVLEDIIACTDSYNRAVEEQRTHHSSIQLRTALLHQAQYSIFSHRPSNRGRHHPAAFTVKELAEILALYHAQKATRQLHRCAPPMTCQKCPHRHNQEVQPSSTSSCGGSTIKTECSSENVQQKNQNFSVHHPLTPLPPSPDCYCQKTSVSNHQPVVSSCVHRRTNCSNKDPPGQNQNNRLDSGQPKRDNKSWGGNSDATQQPSPVSALAAHQLDHSSAELLFQLLVSSNDLGASPETSPGPLLPNKTTNVSSVQDKTKADPAELSRLGTEPNKDQNVQGSSEKSRLEATGSFVCQKTGDEVKAAATKEPEGAGGTHTVQWSDLGRSPVFTDLMARYHSLLWAFYCKAMWLQLLVPPAESTTRSINLHHDDGAPPVLRDMSCHSETDMKLNGEDMLENFTLNLSVNTAHAQWDHVLCTALGSALKDKCLTDAPHSRWTAATSSQQAGGVLITVTMRNILVLFHTLVSSVKRHRPATEVSGEETAVGEDGCSQLRPSVVTLGVQLAGASCTSLALHRQWIVNLALATVQLATVWVMSKSHLFLSSWSLKKFLLITQGDLAVLRESSEMLLCQMKCVLMTSSDCSHWPASQNHSRLLLRRQIQKLDQAVTQLQTFSSTVLNMFSNHCKRKSGELFEQTMPSSSHWRPGRRTGFPSSSSEYASLAARTVIGQVLECMAPLSDDARVQALSITTTAFLEAWMEHILKEKIKFSVQGALQLKQDFDTIREMIQSHEYGLSAELHQQLLSLRVFQQVDSAVMCLLQQPQSKPYLRSRTWLPFTRCCPAHSSSDSVDATVGGSITNLKSMEAEETPSESNTGTTDLHGRGTSAPGEPYLAPSGSLDAAQQQWLDLRMNSSDHWWRLPRLRRLFNSSLNTHPAQM